MKVRQGKGFTFEELRASGISPKVARSIGIAVDHRRRNRSAESLSLNVNRLQTYLSKLVLFPRHSKTPKKGHGGIPADTPRDKIPNNLVQIATKLAIPIEGADKNIELRAIKPEERNFLAFATLRKARKDAKKPIVAVTEAN